MRDIEDIVLKCYANVAESQNMNVTPALDTLITREAGFDSIGIVNFIVELEEAFDMNLDSVLAQIRESKSLRDVVGILEKKRNCGD